MRTLIQWETKIGKLLGNPDDPSDDSSSVRDYYLSENIQRVLEAEPPGTRMIVWAHNMHTSKARYFGILAMGHHLRRAFGEAYYALGFLFNQGSFQAINVDRSDPDVGSLMEFTVGPAREGSVGWYLAAPQINHYIVDFKSASGSAAVRGWLNTARVMRTVGTPFKPGSSGYERSFTPVLADHFDGLVFIEKTSRARPNATGLRSLNAQSQQD